jgi:hypothetical protein
MHAVDRFWAHVVKGDGCWLWNGATNDHGYGQLHLDRRTVYAHRFSYELALGTIPAGLTLDHLCRTPACVNPAHLEAVTQAENNRRGKWGVLKTHCVQGHPFDEANGRTDVHGHRRCRTCERDKSRRARAGRARRGIAA